MYTFIRMLAFVFGIVLLTWAFSDYRDDIALSKSGVLAEVMHASVTETVAKKDGKAPKEGEKSRSLGFTAKVWILNPQSEYAPWLTNQLQRTIELPSVSMPESILKKLQANEKVFVEYLPDNPRVARFPGYKKFSWSSFLTALISLLYSIYPRIFRPALWLTESKVRPKRPTSG